MYATLDGRILLRRISNGMFFIMGEFEGNQLRVFDMSSHDELLDPSEFEYVLPMSTYRVGLEVEVRSAGIQSSGKRGAITVVGHSTVRMSVSSTDQTIVHHWHLHPVGVPVEQPMPPILRPTQLPLFRA